MGSSAQLTIRIDDSDYCNECPIVTFWVNPIDNKDCGYRCDLFRVTYLKEEASDELNETGTIPLKCNACRECINLIKLEGHDGI